MLEIVTTKTAGIHLAEFTEQDQYTGTRNTLSFCTVYVLRKHMILHVVDACYTTCST